MMVELAPNHGIVHFFEASAKEDINVDESFYELVREVRKNRKRAESKIHKRHCCKFL